MAMRPSWQGHLKLSLVTCPVALYNAVSPKGDISFNLINPETGNRVKMLTTDAGTGEELQRKDLVKGYEVAKGEFVLVTQEEIDSVRIESTKTIDIDSFVPADEIDRLYWDNPYYLVPDGKMAAEPFAVIREAMEKSGRVAIARLVMSQRERVVALEARGNGIVATMLRSHEEVRDANAVFSDIPDVKPDKDMIAIAQRIIEQKAMDFDPSEFDDRYQDALRAMIEEKQKGHEISRPAEEKDSGNVVDLMTALRKSLDAKDKKEAPRKTAAKSSGTTKRAVDKPATSKKKKSA